MVKYKRLGDKFISEGTTIKLPIFSKWHCYMYGNTLDKDNGWIWNPEIGAVPNWWVRLCMKILLGCTWVRK